MDMLDIAFKLFTKNGMVASFMTVSYTHLTLPTTERV